MKKLIALLGRKDEPTDGVEEYCTFLGQAFQTHSLDMDLHRVRWHQLGWRASLRELRQQSTGWKGKWVFLQYTALSWSPRGFPWRILSALRLLRRAGACVSVVYHDAEPYPARRMRERVRRVAQLWIMRRSLGNCDLAIFTIPINKISWLPSPPKHAIFIPVGANLTSPRVELSGRKGLDAMPTVSVFGVTRGAAGKLECSLIAVALQLAAREIGTLRLVVFGRHADDAEQFLRKNLQSAPIDLHVSGVVPSEEVARRLSSSDVMLFVRGPISTRRGSAIAGIACGLPVVAFAGSETGGPILEAGVVLVTSGNGTELGEALVRILRDPEYRQSLAQRSRDAHKMYFAWDAIAQAYVSAMERGNSKTFSTIPHEL